jgi:tetratricopeptide (TPR) repeat protein
MTSILSIASIAQDFSVPFDRGEESSGSMEMYHFNLGKQLRKGMDLDSSLWHLHQAESIFKEKQALKKLGECYKEIGVVHCMIGQFNEGKDHFLKAKSLFETLKDSLMISKCLMNLGSAAADQDKYIEALDYYNQAVQIAKKTNDYNFYSSLLQNIGVIHLEQEVHWDSALYYFNDSKRIAIEQDAHHIRAGALVNIGVLFFRQDQNDSALLYFGQALDVSNRHGISDKKLSALTNLKEVYYHMDNMEGAFHFQEAYYLLKDSLLGLSTQDHISELEIEYQTSENEAMLAKLESANSIKTVVIVALVIIFSILFIGGWRVYVNRKKRMFEIAEALYRGRKIEHKKVASHLVNDVGGAIEAATYLMTEDSGKARAYLELANLKIHRLANLNYSQALQTSGIRGALEELIRAMHEESGKLIDSRIILAEEPGEEKQEDIFELTEKILLHTIKINNPEKIDLEVRFKDGKAKITVARITDKPSQSSTVFRNIEATVDHLMGMMNTTIGENNLTTTIIEI